MKKLYFILCFLAPFFLGDASAQESLNMEMHYNYNASGHTYNDCWGYVDAAGNEYAIVGTKLKIYFYNITDPENVTLVDEFSNNNPSGLSMTSTTWRDFKTYGTKAYAVADQNGNTEGLLVFDLSDLPNSVTFEEQNTSFFLRAHNIFVDTISGYLYTAGANTRSNGTIILDLKTDPISLVADEVLTGGGYIHDLYVRNDTAYCNHGYSGMYIWDFKTPTNPVYIADIGTGGYNHSSWVTEDGNYAIYAEEVPIGKPLRVVDLHDLGNIGVVSTFKEPLLAPTYMNNRPHNPYIKGDLLIVSYYHDGVQVFDISDPENPELVGYYDTYHQNTYYPNNYLGCWGVYPYFPSGNIIATDQDNGFFVLEYSEAPLPVELTHFFAKLENEKVRLEWATSSEKNSELFEVQKSADGEHFETIARIDAAGNSDSKIDYRMYDESPFLGDNYYRLKQVDFDGKFEYSTIEVIHFSTSPIEIFPTFIRNIEPLQILFSENISDLKVQVFTIQGQLVKTTLLSGEKEQQQELALDDLDNGTFIIQAFNDTNQVTKRIVILR